MKKSIRFMSIIAFTFVLIINTLTTSFASDKNNRYLNGYNSHLINNSKDFSISDEVKNYIDDINDQYQKTEEKPQVVVEVIESLKGNTIEDYAVKEFEKLKIGNQKYDNGVLVLISSEDRKFRIEVGYGLEGAITDTEAKDILDSSMTFFQNEDYNTGVKNIFNQISEKINEEYNLDIENLEPVESEGVGFGVVFLIFIVIMIVVFIISRFKNDDDHFGGPGSGPRRRQTFYPMGIPNSNSSNNNSGFGGSFGGGGFTGGGGSSGGGGASGGW